MKFFLKIKAWQLFLLIFGLPCGLFFVEDIPRATEDPAVIFVFDLFAILVIAAVFMGWIWTLGTRLNEKVAEEIRMKSGFFRLSIIYNIIYIPCGFVLLAPTDMGNSASGVIPIILPFQLFAFFCLFYGPYFVAKNLVMAERRQEVILPDFARLFFLLLFYPIGVWSIQPRVNNIFQDESDT